jgi:IS605 OrfB family transposase
MQQCLGKQALEIVKSQRKRKKKIKPVFKRKSFNLDSRFVKIDQDINSFDIWFKLKSLYKRNYSDNNKIFIPSKKHKHFNDLIKDKFTIKKSCRIRKTDKGFFLDIFFEKEESLKRIKGRKIGIDIGYKKLVVSSDGYTFGKDIEKICTKISNKKRGSKNYNKALIERDEYINKTAKDILDFYPKIKELKIENLKNVKHRSKFTKNFNNKLQYWSYSKLINRLKLTSEINGVQISEVNPAYTSQTCSFCSCSSKLSRKQEIFECVYCGKILDADHNAAINICMKERL